MKLPDKKTKEVRILFKDDEQFFELEITDHADAFNKDILEKLGHRKNSINGTGDGYAEIFASLEEVNASFGIKEWRISEGVYGKAVSVIFDKTGMRYMDSLFRCDELELVMAGSDFEVIGFQI